jgi:MFS family permease
MFVHVFLDFFLICKLFTYSSTRIIESKLFEGFALSIIFKFRTPWRAVAAMFLLNGALFGVWASRIPAISTQHDLTPGALGMLLLCMAIGALVSFPIAGFASDKFGSATITRKLAIIYAASLILLSLTPVAWALAIALFIFGAFHGAMDVSMNAWAAEIERVGKRPMMSSLHAMFSVGAGLGAASGSAAAALDLEITVHFISVSIALTIITLSMAYIPWESIRKAGMPSTPIFSLPSGSLLAVGFIAFCASLGEGGMADWGAIFIVTVASVSEAKAALGYVVFSSVMVAMRLIGDHIVARTGPVIAARVGGVTAAIGSLVAIFINTFPMILVGFALMGFGYAVIMPIVFTRAANDEFTPPGVAIASVSTLGYGGILLGPPLIGFVADSTSIKTAFLILSVLAFLITLLAGFLTKPPSNR